MTADRHRVIGDIYRPADADKSKNAAACETFV
jgi:hypothetical protein